MKLVLACLVGLGIAGASLAQEEPTRIPLTVYANPAPTPALKYTLLPPPNDLQPGNALLLYYRAFSPEWWGFYHRADAKWHDRLEATLSAPLDKLDKQNEFRFLKTYKMLTEVDLAARRDHCDWEMLPRVKQESFFMLLPDAQSMRAFARFMALRARLEIADGELDKAVYTLQTGYALARHMSEGPSLIQALIGVANAQVMTSQFEEFIQQPKAPNMYWALAGLPRPFIDLTRGVGGEIAMTDAVLDDLKPFEHGPVPLEQAQRILDRFVDRFAEFGVIKKDRVQLTFLAMSLYPKA